MVGEKARCRWPRREGEVHREAVHAEREHASFPPDEIDEKRTAGWAVQLSSGAGEIRQRENRGERARLRQRQHRRGGAEHRDHDRVAAADPISKMSA